MNISINEAKKSNELEELVKFLREAESTMEGRSELQSLTWNTTNEIGA